MTAASFFSHLTDASLSIAILILIILIIRKPFAQMFGSQASYLLWLAPIARLFLPDLNILPAPAPVYTEFLALEPITAAFTTATPQTPVTDNSNFWLLLGLYTWIGGSLVWLCEMASTQLTFLHRKIQQSKNVDPNTERLTAQLGADLGIRRKITVRMFEDQQGPMTVGLFRPVIFLPSDFAHKFTHTEQKLALTHELAHIARGDMVAACLANVFRALQWPNPLVHIAYRAFRADQEAACDAHVMQRQVHKPQSAHAYATAILKSAQTNKMTSAHALTLSHPIKERLMRLKKPLPSQRQNLINAALASSMIVAGLLGTASYGYATQDKEGTAEISKEVKKNVKTKKVIKVSGGEEIILDGVDLEDGKVAKKVVITTENGTKVVQVYDKDGKLLSENVSSAKDGEGSAIKTITVKSKDGKGRVIDLSEEIQGEVWTSHDGEPGAHKKRIIIKSKDGGDFSNVEFDGANKFVFIGDDENVTVGNLDCSSIDGEKSEDGVVSFQLKGDENLSDGAVIAKSISCINIAHDENLTPKEQAKKLREVVKQLKEVEKREAKRRAETIKKLETQIRDLEKKKK